MEIVPYGGWSRCARFEGGGVELIVTLDVGPRIIHLGLVGGSNELAVHEKDRGKTGGGDYRSYGGHRLWIAPEELPKTTQPDNDPVEHREEGGWHVFSSSADAYHIRKEIRVRSRDLGPPHKQSAESEGAF